MQLSDQCTTNPQEAPEWCEIWDPYFNLMLFQAVLTWLIKSLTCPAHRWSGYLAIFFKILWAVLHTTVSNLWEHQLVRFTERKFSNIRWVEFLSHHPIIHWFIEILYQCTTKPSFGALIWINIELIKTQIFVFPRLQHIYNCTVVDVCQFYVATGHICGHMLRL